MNIIIKAKPFDMPQLGKQVSRKDESSKKQIERQETYRVMKIRSITENFSYLTFTKCYNPSYVK